MSVPEARIVVFGLALVEQAVVWSCFAFGNRVGWRTKVGYAVRVPLLLFVAGTPLFQLWIYRLLTDVGPIRDNLVYAILIVEELIAGSIVLYYAHRYDQQQKNT